MIELINASKYYPTRFGRHYIFRNVSLVLPESANIGIIGPNGAGKSTLMRLLAGVDVPSEGRIIRSGRISWPLGLTPGMVGTLTGRENARFVCRIYGMTAKDIEHSILKIANVAAIGNYFDMPVSTFSSGMKSRLNFAISMAIDFDYYLFDEIGAPGDKAFKQISRALIDQRLASSNFILSSHTASDILELCDSAILIRGGELRYFEDVGEALREYGEDVDPALRERRKRKRERAAAKDNPAAAAPASGDQLAAPEKGKKGGRRRTSEPVPPASAAAPGEAASLLSATELAHEAGPETPRPRAAHKNAQRRRAEAPGTLPEMAVPQPGKAPPPVAPGAAPLAPPRDRLRSSAAQREEQSALDRRAAIEKRKAKRSAARAARLNNPPTDGTEPQ